MVSSLSLILPSGLLVRSKCIIVRISIDIPTETFTLGLADKDSDECQIIMSVSLANIVVEHLAGLKLSNVPMFLCIRRTTTAFTLLGEYLILGRVASRQIQVSVAVIVLGTIVAGWETLSDEYLGYIFTLGNNILTAVYLNLSRRFSDETDIKGFGLVYYNSLTAVPVSLLFALFRGELSYVAQFPDLFDPVRRCGRLRAAWPCTLGKSCDLTHPSRRGSFVARCCKLNSYVSLCRPSWRA